MKSVLISIQPKWCELIAIGRKKIELRKTFPNLPIPFKCYIYQTKRNWVYRWAERLGLIRIADALSQGQGRVIGEFTCYAKLRNCEMANADLAERASCVRREEIREYANGKEVYGWGICDLKIYDIPKPLSEFYTWKKCNSCKTSGYEASACTYDDDCKVPAVLKRPPQSWCYVEEKI